MATKEGLAEKLHSALQVNGCPNRIVHAENTNDLQKEIERCRASGLFDEEFFREEHYREELTSFSVSPFDALPNVKSIIIVASPQPQIRLIFTHHGKPRPVFIPPHYVSETDDRVEAIIRRIAPQIHLKKAVLPLKLLATRSGLGEYGRNNICYVPGMGSFHRLVAFYTDLPCVEENWKEPQMMEKCKLCQACVRACPTHAITIDRFLIHAERCLTFHNERVKPFAPWINPSWHNCLVGCLICQKVCPENHMYLDRVKNAYTFSEEETSQILNSTSGNHLSLKTYDRLKMLNMLEYSNVLGRNLAMILNK